MDLFGFLELLSNWVGWMPITIILVIASVIWIEIQKQRIDLFRDVSATLQIKLDESRRDSPDATIGRLSTRLVAANKEIENLENENKLTKEQLENKFKEIISLQLEIRNFQSNIKSFELQAVDLGITSRGTVFAFAQQLKKHGIAESNGVYKFNEGMASWLKEENNPEFNVQISPPTGAEKSTSPKEEH